MNKKLIAVAVAGTFLAPAAALAQSSVTISGKLMASFGQYSIGGRAAGAAGHSRESLVRDESSRIIFSVREDLGGGMAAIGKFDLRPSVADTGVIGNTGESFVGLTSPAWGTIAIGRFDFHYGAHGSYTGTHGGLATNPTALFDVAAAGTANIANQTRTNNSIRYGSPKFGDMFEVVLGYSTNPTAAGTTPFNVVAPSAGSAASGTTNTTSVASTFNNQQESDLRSIVRKGSAWNIAPKIWGKNWEAGYSYWTAKPDLAITNAVTLSNNATPTPVFTAFAPTSVRKDRGDSLYGSYVWGGLRIGLAWNRSRIATTNIAAVPLTFNGQVIGSGGTATTSNRTTWGLPLAYNWGNHTVYGDFYRARADKAAGFAGLDTKANFVGLTYAYDMSKRTTAAVSFSRIRNGANASYNLFAIGGVAAPATAIAGGGMQNVLAGEDPRFIAVTLQHRY